MTILHNLMLKPISQVFVGLMDRIIQKIKKYIDTLCILLYHNDNNTQGVRKRGIIKMTDKEKLEALKKVIEKLEDSISLNKSRTEWIAWDKVLADIEKIINK